MASDLPGKLIGLVLAFVLTVIMPFVTVTTENEMLDRRLIINDVTEFMDEVVDSRQITDAMLKELNSKLASYGMTCDYTIRRYARSVNLDPVSKSNDSDSVDSYYVTYVEQDDTNHWDKGDKIAVNIRVVSYSTTQALAHRLTHIFVRDMDTTLTARIR